MLVSTAKFAETLIRCMTSSEEKFRTVDKDEEIRSVPEAVGEKRHEKNETGRSPQCSDLQTGWALLKPPNEAVRFLT